MKTNLKLNLDTTMNKLAKLILSALYLLSIASCQTITPIDTSKLVIDVKVQDEAGNPIEGAEVSGGFAFLKGVSNFFKKQVL